MLQQYFFFIILFLFPVVIFAEGKSSSKVLPSHLQKAYVIQKEAFIYTRPDFDSMRVSTVPAGARVTITKKVYRPASRFGTFYRIYVSKPKKMKAYISEIDVVPRYIKTGSKLKINPEYKQVIKKLKHVKDFQFNMGPAEDSWDFGDKPLSEMRFVGLIASYAWLAYESHSESLPAWFFGLKLSGAGLPITNIFTDINLMFSYSPPVINKDKMKRGYTILADFLLKMSLLDAPFFLFQLGGGFMLKFKGALYPERRSLYEIGGGLVGVGSLNIKVQKRLSLLVEGKYYYDLLEYKFIPTVTGGILFSF